MDRKTDIEDVGGERKYKKVKVINNETKKEIWRDRKIRSGSKLKETKINKLCDREREK